MCTIYHFRCFKSMTALQLNVYMCIFIYTHSPHSRTNTQYSTNIWLICLTPLHAAHTHTHTKWNETFHRWIYYHLCGFFSIYLFICMCTYVWYAQFGMPLWLVPIHSCRIFSSFEMPIVDWCNTRFLFQSDFSFVWFVAAVAFFNQSNLTILAIR